MRWLKIGPLKIRVEFSLQDLIMITVTFTSEIYLTCPTQNRMKKNESNVYSFWIFAPNIRNFATTEFSPTFSPTSKHRVPTTKPIELQTMSKFGKMLIEIMPKTVMATSTRFTSCRRRAKFSKLLPCRQIWYDIFFK